MNRGEIWTVAGGVYAGKPRPALIIQDNRFDGLESATVIPLTTAPIDAPLIRVPVSATAGTGLTQNSYAMIDKLTTVRRTNVVTHIGTLSSSQLLPVERALIVFLGLAD